VTETPALTPGLYGRRPPKRAAAIQLGPLLTGVVPDHPPAVDYLATLSGWQMLGNDQYGDCVAVTWANERRLTSTVLGTANYPTWPQVQAVYKTQNPGFPHQDNGMDIQTLLEYLVATGGPDGVKAVGFAAVDYTNEAEVQAAIAIFGCLWAGFSVQAANEQQFSAGQPWDYVPGSQIVGGHSVLIGGYGTAGPGALGGDERFITWAAETSFTDNFWNHEMEECWAVIWPEHLGSREFLAGMDLAGFAAAYTALTDKPFPVVVPPTPPPVPPTPPTPPVPPVTGSKPSAICSGIAAEFTSLSKALAAIGQ
jgi:hypothetical protein